jgi:ketosteroid isomerase-like protein
MKLVGDWSVWSDLPVWIAAIEEEAAGRPWLREVRRLGAECRAKDVLINREGHTDEERGAKAYRQAMTAGEILNPEL